MVENGGPALSPGFHRFRILAVHRFLLAGELVVVIGGMGPVLPVLVEICGIQGGRCGTGWGVAKATAHHFVQHGIGSGMALAGVWYGP